METQLGFGAFLMALACIGQSIAQTAISTQQQKPSFTMIIALKQESLRPRSEATISVDMTNALDDKEIQIYRSRSGLQPYIVHVLDQTSRSAPLTPRGRALLDGKSAVKDDKGNIRFLGANSGGMVRVPPGKTLHDEVVLTRLYDLREPGEYTIRLERADPVTKLMVSSNTVKLVVVN